MTTTTTKATTKTTNDLLARLAAKGWKVTYNGRSVKPAMFGEVADKSPAAPKRRKHTQARGKWEGHSATAILRWMGANDWNKEDALTAITTVCGNYKIADCTITIQLNAGRKGKRGAPADITPSQARRLRAAAQ